ncbi:MAG: ATP-binding protein [Desulfobacterales bacterium]|nr:ATP-binding protein [Desulfobacterales bacterium]
MTIKKREQSMSNQEQSKVSPTEEKDRTSGAKPGLSEISFKPTVLVIDDEKRIRDACQRLLIEEGFDADCAENGEIGLKKIEAAHFDIILLDLMMPGISGFDVLASVKSLHPDTLIIVITGYATIEHSIEAMKKGAFDFLPKPFSPKDLRLVVSKAIEYIRTLQDIATEKSRMRVMINSLGDGVLITDNQKKVALANPAFLKMICCTESDVIGRPISEIIAEAVLLAMIDQALQQASDTFVELTEEFSIPGERKEDELIIGVRCIPFRDRLGRNLGTVTVLHDITTLKKIDQLKSDFVSMVAHEIKSPLNSILMQLKVVMDGLAGDLTEKQKEILFRTSDKIKALTMLSSDLLDLSKIESGLINQEKEEFNIAELVRRQVDFYAEQAKAKSLELTMRETDPSIRIVGNKTNIEEVVSNLITNAIRYTPEGGKIKASVEKDKNYARIQVSDTGFGIPEEDLSRIFDRFYRVKNEKTRFINGTGLGLAIVKSIVEAHQGTITVSSKTDQGSTFSVSLPITSS